MTISPPLPRLRATLSGRRVLVTGATGFFGSRLTGFLVESDNEVHAVSRGSPKEGGTVRWWQADLADPGRVRALFQEVRPEYVFHLAGDAVGRREREWVLPLLQGHVMGTTNVLLSALETGARRIVMTGSMEEPEPSTEWVVPSSPYAAAKWASSGYARMFHALYACPVVLLRVFMVYGPGRQNLNKLIPYVALSLLRGETPELSSGTREIDWVYLDDVMEAFLLAAVAEDVDGATIDIGSGRLVSIRELVDGLVELVDAEVEPHFGSLDDRPMEQVKKADVQQAELKLGWTPGTDLREGLRRTVAWYRTLPKASHDEGA